MLAPHFNHLRRYNGGIIGMGSYDLKEIGATEEANEWALEVYRQYGAYPLDLKTLAAQTTECPAEL